MAEGDETALTFIYKKYWEQLFLCAYRLLKDKSTCEDIVQDIFLRLWLKRKEITIATSLEGYLFTAVRYRVFLTIRRGKVHSSVFDDLEQRLWVNPESDVHIYQKELQERVLSIVASLPDRCQTIYRLSREGHLSNREIAERLSVSIKTVENQITIALKRIRKSLPDLLVLIAVLLK